MPPNCHIKPQSTYVDGVRSSLVLVLCVYGQNGQRHRPPIRDGDRAPARLAYSRSRWRKGKAIQRSISKSVFPATVLQTQALTSRNPATLRLLCPFAEAVRRPASMHKGWHSIRSDKRERHAKMAVKVVKNLSPLHQIMPYIRKHGSDPVTGKKLASGDLIKLNFFKNTQGDYYDPVSYKVFNEHTAITAVGSSGNVFSKDTIESLNVKPGFWRDLIDDTEFSRKDLIVLQVGVFHVQISSSI